MYKHSAEAFVTVVHAQRIAENIFTSIGVFCQSSVASGPETRLDFVDGQATVHPVHGGLILKVFARDLVVFYGIRTVLEGSILRYAPSPELAVEWLPADGCGL